MIIKKINIKNFRGIKDLQEIPLSNFTSIVGKNDAGKSIILNAIASYLNPKDYPITISDFNELGNSISIECHFSSDSLKELLTSKIKSKIKKEDGLDEFLNDILFDDQLILKKEIGSPKKTFDSEEILIKDFDSDDFSLLYTKADSELNEVLEKYTIDVPVEGKGRNSKLEKIKHIKAYCKETNVPTIKRYIADEYKISSLLPDVELFVSDYGLEADTKFKTHSVSEIQEYLTKESAEEQKLAIIEKEIEVEMQKEASSVKTYMKDYVSSLKNVELTPKIVWKDAIKSVDVSFQFEGDSKMIPMSHKGTGYRRLFMVARFRYLAEKNKGQNIVYLIEEPETFLHPSAQEDLLGAFRDLSEDNQIMITTHSPVFVGATDINSVVLCTKNEQSIYEFAEEGNEQPFLESIIAELGVKPSFNLRDVHEKIVFVESKNDANFFNILAEKLLDRDFLSDPRILVLPFGGGEDIDSFLNINYFDNSGRELFLIIDSDKQENNESKQQARADDFKGRKDKGESYVLNKSCIENYYHPRAFERLYSLVPNSFDFIGDDENARKNIKTYKIDNEINKNIKEKKQL